MLKTAVADEQSLLPIDRRWFKDLAQFVLEQEGVQDAKIGLAFVGDSKMHELNKRFLAHDYPTDVLTFPMGRGKTLEGEIVVSTDYAARECVQYDWPPEMETSLYVVHGLLHLCGYDDADDAGADRMEVRQKELLDAFAAGRDVYGAGMKTPEAGA
jgi:probable rRNA maturation factor